MATHTCMGQFAVNSLFIHSTHSTSQHIFTEHLLCARCGVPPALEVYLLEHKRQQPSILVGPPLQSTYGYCCCSATVMSYSAASQSASCQASLSFTISWSLLKLMSIESMMPSNHLVRLLRLPGTCLVIFTD